MKFMHGLALGGFISLDIGSYDLEKKGFYFVGNWLNCVLFNFWCASSLLVKVLFTTIDDNHIGRFFLHKFDPQH